MLLKKTKFEFTSPSSILFFTERPSSQKCGKFCNRIKPFKGSPSYIAPEAIDATYDYDCDIWSLGALLYFMLMGFPPFFTRHVNDILVKAMTL